MGTLLLDEMGNAPVSAILPAAVIEEKGAACGDNHFTGDVRILAA